MYMYTLCSDQPMDGSSLFGGGGMFSGLGGQPSSAKANTNVFGTVQQPQPSGSLSLLICTIAYDLCSSVT